MTKKSINKELIKKLIFGLIIIIVFVIIGLIVYYNSDSVKFNKQMDLGHKYLEEQNYKEAIVAFNEAIAIDPMSVEAYHGLADAYIALDDLESALSVLERGYELTQDENINKRILELKQKMITGDFTVLAISDEYDDFVYANNEIFIVGKDNLYGAIDYDNNVIVPLEYSDCCMAANDEGQMWFGNESGYFVFDKYGQVIFDTKNSIKAISEGVVLCSGMVEEDYIIEYIKLDGSVMCQIEMPEYDEYADIASAVGFNDGKAYVYVDDYSEGDKKYYELLSNGELVDVMERYYKISESSVVIDGKVITTKGVNNAGWPIGASRDGYFVSRIYDEVSIVSSTEDEWKDVGLGEFFYDNISENGFDTWQITGYFKDGVWMYNKDTLSCLRLSSEENEIYMLIDAWNESNKKLGEYDYLKINDENLWLISQNGKWGYIDHSGNVMALYDDASDFNDGKAIIIENGIAHMIDEDLNKLNTGCKADSVICYGDIWSLSIDEKTYFVK